MRFHLATAAMGLGVATVSCCAVAQGCGPTRLKVTESLALDMTPREAWAIIGNFQDMSWEGDAVATSGKGGNVPDEASRIVTFKGGTSFGESLYKYDRDAMSYSYHIDKIDVGRLPVQNVSATLEVVADAGGTRTIIRWKAAFYRYLTATEGAPDIADATAARAMKTYLHAGLEGLKAKAVSRT